MFIHAEDLDKWIKGHLGFFFSRHQTGFNKRSVLIAAFKNKPRTACPVQPVVALMHCDL